MLATLKNYILKQRFASSAQGNFTDWHSVKTICIVTQSDSFFNERIINDAFGNEGKTIDLAVYHPDKMGSSPSAFLSFNRRQLDVLSLPKKETLAKLASKQYDVLVDCSLTGNPVTKAMVMQAGAKFRIGHNRLLYPELFELCIEFREEITLPVYLKEVMNYLKMIKTNK